MGDTPEAGDILRAKTWDSYVGQTDMKKRLAVQIRSAIDRQSTMTHTLLSAAPGFGKTTLANIVADQLGDPFLDIVAPIKLRDFANLLREFPYGVLFIDEIHRFSTREQEDLYPLFDEGWIKINGQKIFTTLTIIAATTEPDKVSAALWSRFESKPAFVDYTDTEMALIVEGMASKLGIKCLEDVPDKLAAATGGVPRHARSLILAARDLRLETIDLGNVDAILWQAEMDPDGLESGHIAYLKVLAEFGGKAGQKNIASMLQLPQKIVDQLERLLLKRKYLILEPSGRQLTSQGFAKARGTEQIITRRRRTPEMVGG